MRYGLTGSIGSGKSTTLNYFAQLGFHTFSADKICFEIYEIHEEKITEAFTQRWGNKIFETSGCLNRTKIAEIIFQDENELEFINNLLHPLIEIELENRCTSLPQTEDIIVEVPLLFEKNWELKFDKTICVWSPANCINERLLKRGMKANEIIRRQNAQLSSDEKLERADFGLINSGDEVFLFEQCQTLAKQLMHD